MISFFKICVSTIFLFCYVIVVDISLTFYTLPYSPYLPVFFSHILVRISWKKTGRESLRYRSDFCYENTGTEQLIHAVERLCYYSNLFSRSNNPSLVSFITFPLTRTQTQKQNSFA